MRLSSLTNILQSHLDKDKNATLESAPSIIPLLHKLFNISSSLSLSPILLHSSSKTIPSANPLQSIGQGSTTPKKGPRSPTSSQASTPRGSRKQNAKGHSNNAPPSPRSKNLQVPPVKITPPLCSEAIRHQWVKCLTLAHRLSPPHALPSTNPHVLLSPYMQYASSHPRSAKSAGGCRVAAFMVLSSIFEDEVLGAKYIRALLPEIITLCHGGLRSSGEKDVCHRKHAINCAISTMMAWRDAPSPIVVKQDDSPQKFFVSSCNRVEDKVLIECVKILKKTGDDKFPEVRALGAEFASVLSSMSIAEEHGRSSKREFNALTFLDDIMAIGLKNLDDESVGVSVAWSRALAKCFCTAVEFNSSQEKTPTDQNTDNTSNIKGDFTSKIKAFQEARRAVGTIASQACLNLECAMNFLVDKFSKVGGEAAYKMGGQHSMGSRYAQVGLSLTLIEVCKLQLETGGIGTSTIRDCMNPSLALRLVMSMVGVSMDAKEDDTDPTMIMPSLSELDDSIFTDATSSPKRKKQVVKPSGMGGFLRNISGGVVDSSLRMPSDSTLARAAAARVVRRGLSQNMTETMQHTILRDLASASKPKESNDGYPEYNRHQLQVAMVEISHLVTVLGESCASCLDDIIPALMFCLNDSDHGVRHEAAIAFQSIAIVFPSAGRKHLMTFIGEVQVNQDEVLALGAKSSVTEVPSKDKKRRNRRRQEKDEALISANSTIGKSLDHQYAIHGNALVLSLLLHVLPRVPGGLPSELLDIIMAVADNLVSCQGNANLMKNNPGALVTCVRAGYHIIAGALTMGPRATLPHLQKIFRIWSRSATLIDEERNKLGPKQSVSCMEPFMASLLVFLQNSSEMLVTVPDALNRTISILERLFPIILGYSQMEEGDSKQEFTSTRLDSTKAAVIEAFAWLPPGSYPTISNSIFSFASRQIQLQTKKGGGNTVLLDLLSEEDNIIIARPPTRVENWGQCGNDVVDETFNILTSSCTRLSEREAVIHLLGGRNNTSKRQVDISKPPTPLHQVGNWTLPPVPSYSSKERLLNASIHIFAATFSSLDGHQQTGSVKMLEELFESQQFVNKANLISSAQNIIATLLTLLKALPKSEKNILNANEEAPGWMQIATKLLLTLLPLQDAYSRRGASECLGHLSSLVQSEGTNKLQKSILRVLEVSMVVEVLDANLQQRHHLPTPASANAGCLMTFACIQRSFSESQKENDLKASDGIKVGGAIPTMIMMTRLLPYISAQETSDDSSVSRVYALHSFYLLLSYSKIIECNSVPKVERKHILSKAVEIVEVNFYSAWASNDTETDLLSLEHERATCQPAIFAVLIRLMTYLIPRLFLLRQQDSSAASRFSSMVATMMKKSRYHEHVVMESLKFYECILINKNLLSANLISITGSDNPALDLLCTISDIFSAQNPGIIYDSNVTTLSNCEGSKVCLRAAIGIVQRFVSDPDTHAPLPLLISTLKEQLFSIFCDGLRFRNYTLASNLRSVAVPIRSEILANSSNLLLVEFSQTIGNIIINDVEGAENSLDQAIFWINQLKCILGGECDASGLGDDYGTETVSFLSMMLRQSPLRWQLRMEMTMYLITVVSWVISFAREKHNAPLDYIIERLSPSLGTLVGIACSACVATSDQSELPGLQLKGVHLLRLLVEMFATIPDPNDNGSLILDDYVSLIVPAIKHTLTYDIDAAEEAIDTEGNRNLYIHGCECLQVLTKRCLVPDLHTFKRLLKSILPPCKSLEFSSYPEEDANGCEKLQLKPLSFVDNRRSMLLPRVASLWTIAELYIEGEMGIMQSKYFNALKTEITSMKKELLVNCAAIAIDGCRMNSLELKAMDSRGDTFSCEMKSAITFSNIDEVDTDTKVAMKRSSSSMASFALLLCMDVLQDDDIPDLHTWLDKIVSVILVEFYACFEITSEDDPTSKNQRFCSSILALRKILESDMSLLKDDDLQDIIRHSFQVLNIRNSSDKNIDEQKTENGQDEIVETVSYDDYEIKEACAFLESACKAIQGNDDFLLQQVLKRIHALENISKSSFQSYPSNMEISIALLNSARLLLERKPNPQVSKAMLQFAIHNFDLVTELNNIDLRSSFIDIIKSCLSGDSLSDEERLSYGMLLAEGGHWDAWKACIGSNEEFFIQSLPLFKVSLSDHENIPRHVDALSNVATMMKDSPHLIPTIFGNVGPHILELFHLYGTYDLHGESRTQVCATCMKVIMFTFQHICALEEAKQVCFLALIIDVLVASVAYNGLPNDPKSNQGSDPLIGRLCAQFFVHALRTTPAPFKQCMVSIDANARSILEAAVRADMSGYATHTAPVKKKLNLKSFKK